MYNKLLVATLSCFILLGSVGCTEMNAQGTTNINTKQPRNVIMMVMDGTSVGAVTLARWYKGRDLNLDRMMTGAVRTYSAESAITDSAAASTALATGNKTDRNYIGVLPSKVTTPGKQTDQPKHALMPVANVLEGAKQVGKATGLVATVQMQHATPAGFSAHARSRAQFDDIAEQQVYQGIDVVLGGGSAYLKKARKDKEDLEKVIKQSGYQFVDSRGELLKSKADKIWGSFAENDLAYDFDRPSTKPSQPSLAEMTNKAIKTLVKDKDGFFLFVEGSKVDWAAHNNDIVGMISDILAFDEAVNEAVTFAKQDGNTMVIAVTDHGNSGISMGNNNTTKTYAKIPVSSFTRPLRKARLTVEGALQHLNADRSNIKEVAEVYGLDNLTSTELELLRKSGNIGAEMSALLANRANLGFTTGGHTGEDVFLYAYGPSHPTGYVENTQLAEEMASFMGFNLEKVSQSLFSNARVQLEELGYQTEVNLLDKFNPVLVARKGKNKIMIPANKNIINVNGVSHMLNGVCVYNQSDFYIPEQAMEFVP